MRDLVDLIDRAAVTALQAQQNGMHAAARYQHAAVGTRHPQMRSAIADARTAYEKAGKVARLLGEAANAYTEYVNTIAPGTLPARQVRATAMPSGEDLVIRAGESARKKAGLFNRKLSEKAPDLGDAANNLLQFPDRAPQGPAVTIQPIAQYVPEPQPTPDEIASTMMIVGAIAAAATIRIKELIDRKEESHDD